MGETNGIVVYEGPSALATGAQIVAIVTGLRRSSENRKTGDLLQMWILATDDYPVKVAASGDDRAVCGDCPLRRSQGGSCYVTLHQGPHSVFGAYKRGAYPRVSVQEACEMLRGRPLRFGAYGDPVALPVDLVRSLSGVVSTHTGYTHQWRLTRAKGFKSVLMASVDTEADYAEAKALGWRTFRTLSSVTDVGAREILCPASEEAGSRVTCAECGLCAGTKRAAKDIAVVVHGPLASRHEKIFQKA